MSNLLNTFRKVRAALLRRGVAMDDADDLVHDAFVRVSRYEQAQVVRSRDAVLMRTAINLSVDRKRRARRAPLASGLDLLEQVADGCPQPDEVAIARRRLQRLRDGLENLSERSRRILLARRLDDVSVADIARAEGMTVAAVEKQIARATLRLTDWVDGW